MGFLRTFRPPAKVGLEIRIPDPLEGSAREDLVRSPSDLSLSDLVVTGHREDLGLGVTDPSSPDLYLGPSDLQSGVLWTNFLPTGLASIIQGGIRRFRQLFDPLNDPSSPGYLKEIARLRGVLKAPDFIPSELVPFWATNEVRASLGIPSTETFERIMNLPPFKFGRRRYGLGFEAQYGHLRSNHRLFDLFEAFFKTISTFGVAKEDVVLVENGTGECAATLYSALMFGFKAFSTDVAAEIVEGQNSIFKNLGLSSDRIKMFDAQEGIVPTGDIVVWNHVPGVSTVSRGLPVNEKWEYFSGQVREGGFLVDEVDFSLASDTPIHPPVNRKSEWMLLYYRPNGGSALDPFDGIFPSDWGGKKRIAIWYRVPQ